MATTTVGMPDPAPQPQQKVSSFGRIVGVLFSPKATFEDVVRTPTWVLPSVIFVVLSLVASAIFVQRVDWRDAIAQQMEKDPRAAQLSAEQKEQRVEMGAKLAPVFGYIGGAVAPAFIMIATCLIMWGAYSLLGGITIGFGQSFAITAHACMTSLVSTPVFLLIIFLKPKGTIDIENPIATNLGAFLPEGTSKVLMTLCKQIDVFTIWILLLIAIGFAAVNPRKLKFGGSFGIAFGVWAAYVLVRVGVAFIFS